MFKEYKFCKMPLEITNYNYCYSILTWLYSTNLVIHVCVYIIYIIFQFKLPNNKYLPNYCKLDATNSSARNRFTNINMILNRRCSFMLTKYVSHEPTFQINYEVLAVTCLNEVPKHLYADIDTRVLRQNITGVLKTVHAQICI